MLQKRLLITTALKETWDLEKPVAFLGEWCKIFNEKKHWKDLDHIVLDYKWDNREQFFADYQYTSALYNSLLPALSQKLNGLHNTSHSVAYWRVIAGPWLFFFTEILFERWTQVKIAEESGLISETILLDSDPEDFIPQVMVDLPKYAGSDNWNHFIYSYIIRNFTAIPCVKKSVVNQPKDSFAAGDGKVSTVKNAFVWVLEKFNRKKNTVLVNLVLSKKNIFQLLFKYGYLVNSIRNDDIPRININKQLREWDPIATAENEFEKCLIQIIPLQIPGVYVEGYAEMVNRTRHLFNNRTPKAILTSYVSFDEKVKFYIAQKKSEGSKLMIVQHGGTYGLAKFFANQDHEMAIADHYYTWGWQKEGNRKIISGRMLNANNYLARNSYQQSRILLVLATGLRYSFKLWSEPVGGQWVEYFREQAAFMTALPDQLGKRLTVKLYPVDYGWNDQERYLAECPELTFAGSSDTISSLSVQSRIIVSTYNATTLLETLSRNIPTIIYWQPELWEVNDESITYFNDLASVGIFHTSGISAANKIAEVWDGVEEWWRNEKLQSVVKAFCAYAAVVKQDDISKFVSDIRKISA